MYVYVLYTWELTKKKKKPNAFTRPGSPDFETLNPMSFDGDSEAVNHGMQSDPVDVRNRYRTEDEGKIHDRFENDNDNII